MDITVARIIVPMLKRLKEDKQGIPSSFVIEKDIAFTPVTYHVQPDLFPETLEVYTGESERRWNECLDKMIWSFEQLTDNNDAYSEPYWVDCEPRDLLDIGIMFTKDIDKDKYRQYEERAQEGLELFAKHYHSLCSRLCEIPYQSV